MHAPFLSPLLPQMQDAKHKYNLLKTPGLLRGGCACFVNPLIKLKCQGSQSSGSLEKQASLISVHVNSYFELLYFSLIDCCACCGALR